MEYNQRTGFARKVLKMKHAYVTRFLVAVFLILVWSVVANVLNNSLEAKQPRDLERIADALERLANCSCMQVCDRWHCDASSSSSNGGELP